MSSGVTIAGLRKKYTRLRALETTLFACGVGGALWAIGSWIRLDLYVGASLAVATAASFAIFRIRQLALLTMNNERMSYFLNEAFPQLQESSDLLIRPMDQLSPLQEIQLRRSERALEALGNIKLPHYVLLAVVVFAVGITLAISSNLLLSGGQPLTTPPSAGNGPTTGQPEPTPRFPELASHTIIIQPPAYTGIGMSSTGQLSASAPEGSQLSWALNFTTPPDAVRLQFSNGDSLVLTKREGQYAITRKVDESLIYQVKWESLGATRSSDYFEIRVKPDGVPALNITDLRQFTRLGWDETAFIDVPIVLRDDYGLSNGYIVATVSKGSGESIKFREEKLTFDSPASVRGKSVSARRRIDFRKLGMEPGDEIYFYAEAWDNKQPLSQRARTETFFVSLQDTASMAIVVDASLGVDLMPDYFRSQRQIIIDTEKLLKDQPNISKQQFKSTSNELGYDQKVLRLKYGQFLGEEFETTIGQPAHAETDEDDEDDPTKKFGHQHDKENEHNLVPEKKPEADHEHQEEGDEKDPIAAFKHNHDNMEEATFFTQSVRSKLKAALTLMWDAELQLRLYAPKESLPIQYKILNLLKEISQDSRIYVHRMGFDPPPIKEEKRLSGDLNEIANKESAGAAARDKPYPAIRKALVSINAALQANTNVPDEQLKSDLHDAAAEMAAVSIARPGNYLVHLSMIKSISEGTLSESEYTPALLEIRTAFWKILPYEDPGPGQLPNTRHQLDAGLLEELKRQSNE